LHTSKSLIRELDNNYKQYKIMIDQHMCVPEYLKLEKNEHVHLLNDKLKK